MSIKVTGLKEAQKKLKDLTRKIKQLDGAKVPYSELFPPSFISKHSKFKSIDELFDASGFTMNSEDDFDKIPDKEWDAFINKSTNFSSWEEMTGEATAQYAGKKLGFK